MEVALIVLILLAGFYMSWSIGANDVANAMGTSVGSGALTLKSAVIIAAVLEFSGAFFFGSHVSKTMQSGIVKPEIFNSDPMILVYGMLSALMAAGAWLQLATYYGWPVSTTHTIVGAVVGFGAIIGGMEAIYWGKVSYIVSSWILSPVLGGVIAYYIFTLLRKRILYASDPVASAKKLAPLLIFFIIGTLAFGLIYEGFIQMHWEVSIIGILILASIIGSAGSAISYLLVKRIPSLPKVNPAHVYDHEVLVSLEKAAKHLQRVRAATVGEVQYQVSHLTEEIVELERSLQRKAEIAVSHSEYVKVEKIFGYLQIITACLMAFSHGANDVANAIGPLSASISILLTGIVTADTPVPTWALALGGFGIVVGLATWGWRVIETIGKKITELTPSRGFAAEFGAAATVLLASKLGLPVSTTHTLVGAVIGVGFARGIGALNLITTRDIFISWLVTVPVGAGITIVFFYFFKLIFGF